MKGVAVEWWLGSRQWSRCMLLAWGAGVYVRGQCEMCGCIARSGVRVAGEGGEMHA